MHWISDEVAMTNRNIMLLERFMRLIYMSVMFIIAISVDIYMKMNIKAARMNAYNCTGGCGLVVINILLFINRKMTINDQFDPLKSKIFNFQYLQREKIVPGHD